MAAPPGEEAPQELRPAESGCSALAVVSLDLGGVVGALIASFVFPALKRLTLAAGRRHEPPLWLDVRVEHGLLLSHDVLGYGRDQRLAVRFWGELFLEALERV